MWRIITVRCRAGAARSSADITDPTPVYTWNAVENSTWYYLYVNGSSGNVLKIWYQASLVCSAGVCSAEPATVLGSGSYTWWVQSYNSVGYGAWSAGMSFNTSATGDPATATFTATPPPTATLTSTETPTVTPTGTETPTPTETPTRDRDGDCNGNSDCHRNAPRFTHHHRHHHRDPFPDARTGAL